MTDLEVEQVIESEAVAAGGLSPEDVATAPLERLEEEMRTLAGHIAAATCSFLVLVGEYDARRGWSTWEALSCAHWLNWRCGVGMTAAREQVRVARRLRELPAITEAFSRGALSYSKVRAITRVAHANNEESLVRLAQASTAAHLERSISALRRCEGQGTDADLETDEHRAQRLRALSWYTDDSGDLIGKFRIPAGRDVDTFLTAIQGRTVPSADADTEERLQARRLDALLDSLHAGTSVDDTLATQPEIVIHYTAAQTPAGGSTPFTDTDSSSAEAPETDTDVDDTQGTDGSSVTSGSRPRIDLSGAAWPINTSRGTQLSTSTFDALVDDAGIRAVIDLLDTDGVLVTSLDLGRHKRFPSPALRRAVMRRDGGCCRFPGCERRYRLNVHHIIWWEHGGRTELDNLLLLCPKHHAAIHNRHWTLTGTATNCEFQRPDGLTVDPTAAQLFGDTAHLVEQHRLYGRDIAADGAGSRWNGDRMDWASFFAAFANGPRSQPPEPNTATTNPGDPVNQAAAHSAATGDPRMN